MFDMIVPLKDIAEVSAGQGAPQGKEGYSHKGRPFIKAGSLEDLIVTNDEYKSCQLVDDETAKKYKLKTFPKNTIVFAKSGMSAMKARVYCLQNDSYVVNHLAAIKPKQNKIVPGYLKYYLQKFSPSHLINDSAYPSIRLIDIKSIQIPLPLLEEQNRIVRILDQADAFRQKRKQAIELLDDYLKAVFLDMFGNALSSSEQENKELREYIKVTGGYAFKSTDFVREGIPVIKIGTVNKGYFDLKACSYMEESIFDNQKISKYKILPGDLLMSLTGTVGKEDYGNICLANDDYHTYLLNQRVAKIEYDKEVFTPEFLFHYFKQPEIKRQLISVSRGVRQANINNEDILKLKITVPHIDKQKKFSTVCTKKRSIKKEMLTQLKELDMYFKSLMQKALKGE